MLSNYQQDPMFDQKPPSTLKVADWNIFIAPEKRDDIKKNIPSYNVNAVNIYYVEKCDSSKIYFYYNFKSFQCKIVEKHTFLKFFFVIF